MFSATACVSSIASHTLPKRWLLISPALSPNRGSVSRSGEALQAFRQVATLCTAATIAAFVRVSDGPAGASGPALQCRETATVTRQAPPPSYADTQPRVRSTSSSEGNRPVAFFE